MNERTAIQELQQQVKDLTYRNDQLQKALNNLGRIQGSLLIYGDESEIHAPPERYYSEIAVERMLAHERQFVIEKLNVAFNEFLCSYVMNLMELNIIIAITDAVAHSREKEVMKATLNGLYPKLAKAMAEFKTHRVNMNEREAAQGLWACFEARFIGMEKVLQENDGGEYLRGIHPLNGLIYLNELVSAWSNLNLGGRPKDAGKHWLATRGYELNPESKRAWKIVAQQILQELNAVPSVDLTPEQYGALELLKNPPYESKHSLPENALRGEYLQKLVKRYRKNEKKGGTKPVSPPPFYLTKNK